MLIQTLVNTPAPAATATKADHVAITRRMNELKQAEPEWDGPGSITPEPVLIDLAADWLKQHWRASLGMPNICPTSDGGVSISWEWGAIEHSLDVHADGSGMEWCQYNPRTLQTIETELPMNKRGWDAIQAGLENSAA